MLPLGASGDEARWSAARAVAIVAARQSMPQTALALPRMCHRWSPIGRLLSKIKDEEFAHLARPLDGANPVVFDPESHQKGGPSDPRRDDAPEVSSREEA